jgi:hypothetical protein
VLGLSQKHTAHGVPTKDKQRKPQGEGTGGIYGLAGAGNKWLPTETWHTRREDRHTTTSCGYDVLPRAPKGGGSILGGELRREEQLISHEGVRRSSRGLRRHEQGFFRPPFLLPLRDDRSRTTAEVRHAQLDHMLTR